MVQNEKEELVSDAASDTRSAKATARIAMANVDQSSKERAFAANAVKHWMSPQDLWTGNSRNRSEAVDRRHHCRGGAKVQIPRWLQQMMADRSPLTEEPGAPLWTKWRANCSATVSRGNVGGMDAENWASWLRWFLYVRMVEGAQEAQMACAVVCGRTEKEPVVMGSKEERMD
jgi:hypothetical protein